MDVEVHVKAWFGKAALNKDFTKLLLPANLKISPPLFLTCYCRYCRLQDFAHLQRSAVPYQMETLSDEIWDVVIAGTSIPQSLLALYVPLSYVESRLKLTDKDPLDRSLSRSGKKVLHVDRHDYYGGDDAGLSLQDVEKWVQELDNGRALIKSR